MRWALLLAVVALGCDGPKSQPSSRPSTELNALFERASQLAARDPKTALELFRKVVTEAGPEDPLRAQAMARVAQLTSGPDTSGAEGHGGVAIAAPAVAPPSSDAARDLYLRGYQLRASDRRGAIDAFQRVVEMTPPADELHEKAKRRLDELSPVSELEDAYQRAYVIREHDRAAALQLFRRVAAEAPAGSALQQRAEAEAQKLAP